MELKVLEKSSKKLRFEIEGEGHTFFNLLETALLQDKQVEFAGYYVPHPLVSKTIMEIRTKKGTTPEKALNRGLKKLLQLGKEFSESLKNIINIYEEVKS
jgi:DNA-directed RNA polymerase subunit L